MSGFGNDDVTPFSPLSQALTEYLHGIVDGLESVDADDDFAATVLKECSGWETNICFSAEGSRLLEKIARHASPFARAFLDCLLTQVKKKLFFMVMRSRNGSHVLETLLEASIPSDIDLKPKEHKSISEDIIRLLSTLATLVSEEWINLVREQGSCFVLRSLGGVLAGVRREEEGWGKGPDKKRRRAPVEEEKAQRELTEVGRNNWEYLKNQQEVKDAFSLMVTRALDWNLMKDELTGQAGSLLVQDFLRYDSAAKTDQLGHFLEASFESKDKKAILRQWKDKQGSRVWEQILKLCSKNEEQIEGIFHNLIEGNLAKLALDPFGNFPLQRLLELCKTEEMLSDVLDELESELPAVLSAKYYGVLSALLEGAANVGDLDFQKRILKAIRKAFCCRKPKNKQTELIPRVLCLAAHEELQTTSSSDGISFDTGLLQYHGSLMAQKLIKFKAKSVMRSVLSMSPDCVLNIACHTSGSHFVDELLKSRKSTAEDRENLNKKLSKDWPGLAMDKYGSRVLDTVWSQVPMKEKSEIAAELAKKLIDLRRNQFGRLLVFKYHIDTYQKNVKEWRNAVAAKQNKDKKRKQFAAIMK